MTRLTQKEIDIYSQKILEDYDANNPGTIFKDKINISNVDALILQSSVSKLREKRGEEIIGYKIGCVLKETQKKMGFTQPAWGTLWKNELHKNGAILNKKDYRADILDIKGNYLAKTIKSIDIGIKTSDIIDKKKLLLSLKIIFPSLNMRSSGCAALDLAYVGSGRLDGFFHNKINLWDIAAGVLIVQEAGGTTNDLSKFLDDKIDIRAASSSIYSKMMEKILHYYKLLRNILHL